MLKISILSKEKIQRRELREFQNFSRTRSKNYSHMIYISYVIRLLGRVIGDLRNKRGEQR